MKGENQVYITIMSLVFIYGVLPFYWNLIPFTMIAVCLLWREEIFFRKKR